MIRLGSYRRLRRMVVVGVLGSFSIGAVDPLTARIEDGDAQRFARVFGRTAGKPSAAQLQADYLYGAGQGVQVFMPDRIKDATNLAAAVTRGRANYAYAIRTCLPLVNGLNAELRSTYLAYRGLLPDRPLPKVYVVFGAGNSGGTASSEAQGMGLEVTCSVGTTPEQFRTTMRAMFAHETVHSWQPEPTKAEMKDLLLWAALREGVPDYLASLVTGKVPGPDRNVWASARELWLWNQFKQDRPLITDPEAPSSEPIFKRWFANYGNPPKGWKSEAGYWIGMRIAERYVERASDKHAAIEDLIALKDPAAILKASGYDGH